ncbi:MULTISPECIES: hypothetical protein [Pseudoalteromonas]|uniref:Uncharacterized protein n=1 Tax=Pseudoalteromonas obscura TaxID=3048491 RepID=A0ABT7ERF5_9GAMM|nr:MULTISPECIES: hypothetical protein [Pseudoalteromonas]MBQ4838327.1 hypothetical protein [Pseudoalteromonas luteoviolacea]MDK2597640.1 hypothetical protein [Pseudoalteromonas sp. P94(2023)]
MASLLHVSFYILAVNKNVQALACASILAASYSLSDLTTSVNFESIDFAIYFVYDIVTLAIVIMSRHFFYKYDPRQPCYIYCSLGLTINAMLFLAMFIDSHLLGTDEPWALWYFYSSMVNIVDLVMVGALILNRDFLGLQLISRRVFNIKTSS